MIRFKAKIVAFALGVAVACLSTGLAQIPIGNLPHATTPLSGSEVAVVNQNGVTRQVAVSAIGGTAKPAGSFQLPFQSGDIQWNNNGAFFATDQFIAGLSIPLPDGTNGAALLVGSGFGPGGSGHAGKAWILTDQAFDAVTPGNTLGITAGETQGSGTANGGLLWLLGGASFGGTGGETLIQGGTSANGAGGPTVVQGGNATGLGAGAIPGDLFLEGGQVGQQGANVHLIMTTLNGISGVVRIRNNSTPLWDFFANGSIFDYSGGGFGTSGQVLTSAGPGSPVTWSSPVVTGFGNRTNLIGLTANNGVAGTAARSDSTPALSQAISPVWTGIHVFAPSSGVGLQIQGLASNFAEQINGTTSAGTSFGPHWLIGTNASDLVWRVDNATGGTRFLDWFGDGGLVFGSATGGDKGLGTINATGLFVNGTAVTGGTPGGSSGQLQFNNAGAFGGAAGTTWDNVNTKLTIATANTSINPEGYCANGLTATNRCWSWRIGTGADLQLSTADDTGAPTKQVFDISRTGTVVSSINIGNATDRPAINLTGPTALIGPTTGVSCIGNIATSCFSNTTTGHTAWTTLVAPNGGTGNELGLFIQGTSSSSTDTLFRIDSAAGTGLLSVTEDRVVKSNGFPIGQILTCTTACNAAAIQVGQSASVAKLVQTNRSSTTTLTNDPDLQITGLPAGTYWITIDVQFLFTNSTGGSQIRVAEGGATSFEMGTGQAFCNGTITPYMEGVGVGTPATCTGTSNSGSHYAGTFSRTVSAGTISIQWAQNSSNASATTLSQNSAMMVTRIN